MDNQFTRTINLIGESNFKEIQNKTIAILGLGGVGGTTFLSLVRTGFRKFVIVDKDIVSISNLNRQLLYTNSDIGKRKIDVAIKRAKEISNDVSIESLDIAITMDNIGEIFKDNNIDFIVDCVDDIKAKIGIVKYAKSKNIPFICSMGMAKRMDPEKIKISTLNKATSDPLAKKFRYELKQNDVDVSNIPVVCSNEIVEGGKELNSIVTVTSTAGLLLASYVIRYSIKE